MLVFTVWSFYFEICTSGSQKLPCIDVSTHISYSQTSAIFTADTKQGQRELTFLVHRQAKAWMPCCFSVLQKIRTDKGKEKTKESLQCFSILLAELSVVLHPSYLVSILILHFGSFVLSALGQSVEPEKEDNLLNKNMLKTSSWIKAHVLPLHWKEKGAAEPKDALIYQNFFCNYQARW